MNELESITRSQADFDINRPLTEDELTLAGQLLSLPGTREPRKRTVSLSQPPLLKDLDLLEEPEQAGEPTAIEDYNAVYSHYLGCQALVALASFKEGWEALEKQVFEKYVRERRLANAQYRGHDPNESFALRLKQQAAEDFLVFIRASVNEAAAVQKPVLKQGQ